MIYIACPEKFATGGTELLHQLYYKINKIREDVRIYYYNKSDEFPTAEKFLKYNIKFVEKIEDKKNNILIVPEVNTEELTKYIEIKKYIWWLSVDNYTSKYAFYLKEKINKERNYLVKFKLYRNMRRRIKNNEIELLNINEKNIKHLVQSKYAEEFLKSKNIQSENIKYLSDYISDEFFKQDIKKYKRENIVLYNPKKGLEFTKELMKGYPQYKYIALENMTSLEIVEICLKSKIYIDFGEHPGKDRFPRETAILGCIILTGKKGSAKYYEDISIPEEYKFEDEKLNKNIIKKVGEKIDFIFNNYEENYNKLENYREKIRNEEKVFEKEILEFLENI